MSAAFDEAVRRHRLVAILRGTPPEHFAGLVEALLGSGVRLIEVSLSEPGAAQQVARLRQLAGPEVWVGAGTVTSLALAQEALEAGAGFLVTPHVVPEVVAFAAEWGLGMLCGAMTPGEIATARGLGVRFIKLFPASALGPDYLRALLGPYPDLELLVVGGVHSGNLGAYLRAGALGAGVGGALARVDEGYASAKAEAAALLQLLAPA